MADGELGYRLRAEARRDIQEIWRYTRARWGLRQARNYHQKLTLAFLLLARNPKLGVSCRIVRRKYRKKSVGRHIIYYRIEDGVVTVVRVLHERMQAWRRIRTTERNGS